MSTTTNPAMLTARPATRVSRDLSWFDPAPAWRSLPDVVVDVARTAPASTAAIGVPVGEKGAVPRQLGVDRGTLAALGFEGKAGQTIVIPRREGADVVAVGTGGDRLSLAELRDAAAAFTRAVAKHSRLATSLHDATAGDAAKSAQAVVEGVLLARYRFESLKSNGDAAPVDSLTLVAPTAQHAALQPGIARGRTTARAAALARDLANSPPSHLTATRLADLAVEIGAASGCEVEVFDADQLAELGCGGLLAVNAGSAEPPRMIKLRYRPKRAAKAHLALVGKGIMYDSGGISLKPSDPMHAAMKMDMSGAAAVLATMSALAAVECRNAVTAWMMCTDNMPSGSANKLGDVLHIHGGKTVEVHNTDAEGRLVLADGLVLAAEEQPDAIVDIATLTGAAVIALGTGYAGVLGNDQSLVDRIRQSAEAVDEPVWQLPLETKRYRKLLDSDVADLKNIGNQYGGAITAAVFLSEFPGDVPWAHLDIAPTMKVDADESWRSKGATGFGTRLLIDLASTFTKPT
ncbi:MAG: leucyl aminopeptidase [Acidimicrobiales bacterium]